MSWVHIQRESIGYLAGGKLLRINWNSPFAHRIFAAMQSVQARLPWDMIRGQHGGLSGNVNNYWWNSAGVAKQTNIGGQEQVNGIRSQSTTTREHSIVAMIRPWTSSTVTEGPAIRNGTGGFTALTIGASNSVARVWSTRDSTTGNTSDVSLLRGNPLAVCVAGACSATTIEGCVEGAYMSQSVAPVGNYQHAPTGVCGADGGVPHVFVIGFDRRLQKGELQELSLRPDALVQPVMRVFYSLPAAAGNTDLTVSDASHGHAAEAPGLTLAVNVAPSDASHAHAAEAPAVTQTTHSSVTVSDAAHGHAAEAPATTSASSVTASDATHGHSAEAPATTSASSVTAADATHGHAAESPSLDSGAVLTVADASHGHTAEAPATTSATTLTAADATHGHAAEAPATTSAHSVVAADALHAHASESPAVSEDTNNTTLTVADAAHGHSAESPATTTAMSITVSDATHGHTAEVVSLAATGEVVVADASHGHTAESVGLTLSIVLTVDDALHGQLCDAVGITSAHSITAADALHAVSSDTAFLSSTPPSERRAFVVSGAERSHVVSGRERAHVQ